MSETCNNSKIPQNKQIKSCLHTPEDILYFVNSAFVKKSIFSSKINNNRFPITTTRLNKAMKCNIDPYSIFIINNRCIKRWTDGYKWHEPSPGDFWSITAQVGIKKRHDTKKEEFNDTFNLFTNSPLNEKKCKQNKITEMYLKKFHFPEINNSIDEKLFTGTSALKKETSKIEEMFVGGTLNATFSDISLVKKTCKFYFENEPFTIIVYTTIRDEMTRICCKKFPKTRNDIDIESMKQFRFLSARFFNTSLFKKEDKNVFKFLYQFVQLSNVVKVKPLEEKENRKINNQETYFFGDDGSIISEEVDLERGIMFDFQPSSSKENCSINSYTGDFMDRVIKWHSHELMHSSNFDDPVLKMSKNFLNSKNENKITSIKIVRPEKHFKNHCNTE